MSGDKFNFGDELVEALQQLKAWKRGEIELEMVEYPDPMPPARVRAIRKRLAKSRAEFERRFHIPARTLENWEQGRRKVDPTARVLLTVIDKEPELVERALKDDAA